MNLFENNGAIFSDYQNKYTVRPFNQTKETTMSNEKVYIIGSGHIPGHLTEKINECFGVITAQKAKEMALENPRPEPIAFPIINPIPDEYYFQSPPTRRERRAAQRKTTGRRK